MLTTVLLYIVMVVALGIVTGVLIRVIKKVYSKSVEQGVVYSDGVQSHEADIIKRLVNETLKEERSEEQLAAAVELMKRVVSKLSKKPV